MTGPPIEPRGEDARDRDPVDASVGRLSALEAQVSVIAARLAREDGSRSAPAEDSKLANRIGDRVDVLAGRIDTLSETARSASGAVVARERELADVRRELGELRDRVDRAVADLHLVDRAPVEALQRTAATVSKEVATLRQEHDRLDERLDSLAIAAGDDREEVADHARSLAELRAAVEGTGVRMDSVVSIVRQAVEGLLSQAGGSTASAEGVASEAPLEQLTRAVDTLAADTRLHAEQQQDLLAAQVALRERLDELARQLAHDEPRPRLVTLATPTTSAGTERTGDPDAGGDEVARETTASSLDGGSLYPADAGTDTTGSIVSLGGGR